jgi:hypothetical protein
MKPLRWIAVALLALVAAAPMAVADKEDEGFVPMFNGKDLTGWVNVNCAPGTFYVKENEIITTGKPTGFLRTAKQYENFIADFEWMHVNKKEVGNSGFFVWADPIPAVGTGYTRGIEVQVLVNLQKEGYYTSQGDLFSIWGATCKPDRPHPHGWARCLPSENRCKGGGEWNHYRVIGNNGTLKLEVNGKEVSGLSECKPRKGYLALESEGAECHFRKLKIKELPSTNPKPDEVADEDKGFVSLYTGLDLSGWKADDEAKKHWQPRDYILHYDGKGEALRNEKERGDSEYIVDFRFPPKGAAPCTFVLGDVKKNMTRWLVNVTVTPAGKCRALPSGEEVSIALTDPKTNNGWNRLHATRKGGVLSVTVNGKPVLKAERAELPGGGAFTLRPEGEMDFANLFVRELK